MLIHISVMMLMMMLMMMLVMMLMMLMICTCVGVTMAVPADPVNPDTASLLASTSAKYSEL